MLQFQRFGQEKKNQNKTKEQTLKQRKISSRQQNERVISYCQISMQGKAEYLASGIIELAGSSCSCVWTAELWVILHVQALKPKGDKYKGFVVSS